MFDPESVVARLAETPAGAQLAAALDDLDPSSLDGALRVDVLVALARQAAHTQARLLAGMAAVAERSVGQGFDADEVAFALHLTRRGAQNQVALAQDLLSRLPAVWAALDSGALCPVRARVFSDVLSPAADQLARKIAEKLLPAAAGWTAGQLRARLLRELLKADPGLAAARYHRSISQRRLHLAANDDTTACLTGIYLPPAKAAAGYERVDAIARGMKHDGDTRTLDQLRADVFCDLLAGIGPAATPIARTGVVELLIPLDTLTGQSDAPGHLAGYGPVIADIARQVAGQQATQQEAETAAAAQFAATVPQGISPTVRPNVQWRYRVYDTDGRLLYHGTTRARPTPEGSKANTGPQQPELFPPPGPPPDARPPHQTGAPPQPPGTPEADAIPSPHTPAMPTIATYGSTRIAPGVFALRPLTPYPPAQPDPTARFPNSATRRWIAARDGTCRAPGCTTPARICDTDHTEDHAHGGPTTDDNLGLLCRHHHRLKHEGGHYVVQSRPGEFLWISPNDHTYTVDRDAPW